MQATREVVWSFVAVSAAHGKVLSFGDALQAFNAMTEEEQQDALDLSESHGSSAKCKCDVCDRLRAGESWEDIANHFIGIINRSREQAGFLVQYVTTREYPFGVDIRTCGLEDDDSFGREVQVVLRLSGEVVCRVLVCFAEVVRKNKICLCNGLVVPHVLGDGMPVKVVSVVSGSRSLWRLIMPDSDGSVERDEFVAKGNGFERQYDEVNCGE